MNLLQFGKATGTLLAIAVFIGTGITSTALAAEEEELLLEDVGTTYQNRADVVQFIDETHTGVGHATAYIAWRELFGSIQDLRSSGTKLLTFESDPTIQGRIVDEYNYDVTRIAEEHAADFVVWGVVREVDDTVLLWSHLAVSDNQLGPSLELRVDYEGNRPHSLAAQLPRKQFNFTPTRLRLDELGQRRWHVKYSDATIFAAPNPGMATRGSVDVSRHFNSRGITDHWLTLDSAGSDDSAERFVQTGQLDLLPRRVSLPERFQLWVEPSRGAGSMQAVGSANTYEVENLAYVGASDIKWFEIRVGDQRGWVPAENVVTSQSLPAGYLLTAMLRFQGAEYARAVNEVRMFVQDGRETDNAILAFANELRAAAAIMGADSSDRSGPAAIHWLDLAVEGTPFDPAAYRLRTIALVSQGESWDAVIDDLSKAVDLDRRDPETHTLLTALIGIVADDELQGQLFSNAAGTAAGDVQAELMALQAKLLPVVATGQ